MSYLLTYSTCTQLVNMYKCVLPLLYRYTSNTGVLPVCCQLNVYYMYRCVLPLLYRCTSNTGVLPVHCQLNVYYMYKCVLPLLYRCTSNTGVLPVRCQHLLVLLRLLTSQVTFLLRQKLFFIVHIWIVSLKDLNRLRMLQLCTVLSVYRRAVSKRMTAKSKSESESIILKSESTNIIQVSSNVQSMPITGTFISYTR